MFTHHIFQLSEDIPEKRLTEKPAAGRLQHSEQVTGVVFRASAGLKLVFYAQWNGAKS
jgi:hypothetical protein